MTNLAYHVAEMTKAVRRRHLRDARVPVLTPPSRATGWLGVFARSPLTVLDRANDVADVVRFRIAYRDVYLVNEPHAIGHVLFDNDDNYRRGQQSHGELRRVLGPGMLTADDDEWERYRRLAQPSFRDARLAAVSACIDRLAPSLLERWAQAARDGRELLLGPETMRMTVRIAAEAFFQYRLDDGRAYRFFDALMLSQADAFTRAVSLRTALFPFRPRPQSPVGAAYRFLRQLCEDIADSAAASQDDYLGDLRAPGAGLEREVLLAQIMTMIVSAPENPSNLLTFALFLLGTRPELERQARDEVRAVFGDQPVTSAGLRQLVLLRAIVQETLRLYPGAWGFERMAIADDEVGGYRIRAGSTVLLSPYAMHRNPRHWDRPLVFDPARFLEPRVERHRFAYFPFGGGKRTCIGNRLAETLGLHLLASLLQRFRITPTSAELPRLAALFTLRPAGPVKVRVSAV